MQASNDIQKGVVFPIVYGGILSFIFCYFRMSKLFQPVRLK